MFAFAAHSILAALTYEEMHEFVDSYKVHPILVNFTAALIPISVLSDLLGRLFGRQTLRDTGWWTLCFAAVITPFTATAGWLWWMPDDSKAAGMITHKWLGTSLAVLLIGLAGWRWWFFKSDRWPNFLYLLVALAVVGAVVYQGYLGGEHTFASM
jgi:uncharacterized membrane protein